MPLVNGIESYSIYTQRLSQIAVVVSGVKSCSVIFLTVVSSLLTGARLYEFS